MGDAKGSPRPWVRFKVTDQPDMIGDAKDGVVCRPPAPSCYTDKWEVDADLIVSSVNARDAAIALGDARSRLIAHVSHEIRTPLTSIIGLTSMLLDTDLAEEQREMVATTALASDRLLQLVNEILDFARGDAGHAVLREVDFSPAELLAEVSRIVRPAARTKDVEVGTSVGTGTPAVVHGDRDKLRTVLSTSPGTR